MKRLFFLLLVAPCFAQTQGNLPQVRFACSDGSLAQPNTGACVLGDNVVSGQTLIDFVSAPIGAVPPTTDSLGNTFTCTSAVAQPPPDANRQIYACYVNSAFSGADTVTACAAGACTVTVLVTNSKVGAFDLSASTTGSSSGLYTLTNSITITANGDLLVSGLINGTLNNHDASLRDSYTSGSASGASQSRNTAQQNTGAKGAYSVIADVYAEAAFGNIPTSALLTLAFKPSAIMLTDTAMPDAATGVAYSAQLHGIGGNASLTYACTGLPANGFTLNTSTGVISASNPTATTAIGCTVTDGSTTSVTDSLTITDKPSFDIPAVRTVISPTVDGGATTIPSARCGDIGVFFTQGDDTHFTTGWLQAFDGSNNFVTDSFGSTITRYVGPWGNEFQNPLVAYIIGPFSHSGSDVVTISNNQQASSNLDISPIFLISGGQVVVDSGSTTNIMTRADGAISASYTSLVPNTLLLGAIAGAGVDSITHIGTPSMAAPFTPDLTGKQIYGHYLASAAGAVILTNNVTGQGTVNNAWTTMILPIRAGIAASSCNVFTGAGEKIRRQVY